MEQVLPHSQSQCLSQLIADESLALQELYHTHRHDFFSFIQKKIQADKAEIADLYQDAMVIFFLNLRKGKIQELPNGPFPYIIGIAKNLLLKRRYSSAKEIYFDPNDEQFIQKLDFPEEATEEALEPAEKRLLSSGLGQLSENCLTIIKLFYYQNISIEAITQQMGYASEEVTRVTKMRCIQKLRELYARSGKDSLYQR
ncbi:MAG: sigma-70 family RNA polymerase sigma factor [Phycisphaerae bacterium]|nr:sigma-70 family RNA polymerase sigma factor [Saprospiraceae bacterium]